MESFKNTSTSGAGFRLGGAPNSAILTAAGPDTNGNGYLRLTTDANNQSGFAIDKSSFPAPSGFSISFEFFSYGGSGADGFSVFLIDADKTSADNFTIGASGGSLGYAQKTVDPKSNGVPNGYVGIGIDEFGNFSSSSEGRSGGPGQRPDAVTLRGPGNGNSDTDYPYIASSGTLPFSLDVTTVRAQQGSSDFRRAYIDVIPQPNSTYQITVRIQNGNAVTTAVDRVTISTPPSNLRIGFSGSTGGNNNFHEIRNLSIVKAPFANDDLAGTRFDAPVTLNVLSNDVAQGSNLDVNSVDLDPSTPAIDKTRTVTGQGTFSVTNGVVTFQPSRTFSGVVRLPYTVASVLGDRSSPANIVVTVTGADVATTISGPSSVNPGSAATYVVTAYNNGQEDAPGLAPTLTLPANVEYRSGGTFNPTTRVVTFPTSTLTTGQSVSHEVVLGFPGSLGTYSLVSRYAYASTIIPDAVAANNSSTLAVLVAGTGNVTGVCALPGKDGVVTLATNTTYNTYYPGTASVAAGATTIPVGAATGNGTAIAAGDLLLIMQMQDAATINTGNDADYGKLGAANTAGRYEYAVADAAISAGQIRLKAGLVNAYTATNARYQVIRIPQFSKVTLSGAVSAPAWNGSTGGVLALEVGGEINFANGTLNMDGKGFRGGAGRRTNSGARTDYVAATSANNHSSKGEGLAGAPEYLYVGGGSVASSVSYETLASGSYARGRAGTGGGGGTVGNSTNNHAGGGGGGNFGAGGTGEFYNGGFFSGSRTTGGIGGVADIQPSASRLYLGGGGGAGTTVATGATALQSSGGTGGGLILLRAGSVSGTNTVTANGTPGSTPASDTYGGGGGGAGGTIVINATSGLDNLTLRAIGGAGGSSTRDGGGGGGGGIFVNGTLAASPTTGGSNGSTAAGSGSSSTTSTVGAACLPTLSTTLRTTTPQIARSATMTANYVLTISNTGGGYRGLSISPSLGKNDEGRITYASTSRVLLRLPNGTTQLLTNGTDYTVSNTAASTPTLTLAPTYLVPAGASLELSFTARISSAALNGVAYVSDAGADYLNPARASADATISAAGYASAGTAAAPDAVTINQPLPVTLTRFEARTAALDALLTWATAQELNNDQFEVERSLNGADFEKIGTVRGKGTTAAATTYHFTDTGAARLTSKALYYRLRQLDMDGTGSYSAVRTVRFERQSGSASLYPNPHQGRFTLDLLALPAGLYQVEVLDLAGRRVYQTQLGGGQEHPLLPTLPMGSYIVRVTGQAVNINLPMVKN